MTEESSTCFAGLGFSPCLGTGVLPGPPRFGVPLVNLLRAFRLLGVPSPSFKGTIVVVLASSAFLRFRVRPEPLLLSSS